MYYSKFHKDQKGEEHLKLRAHAKTKYILNLLFLYTVKKVFTLKKKVFLHTHIPLYAESLVLLLQLLAVKGELVPPARLVVQLRA